MATVENKGLSNQWLRNYIPDGPLDGAWFRDFCVRYLVNADVRNATAGSNVTITGNIGTPATITASGGTASPLTTKGDLWGYSSTNARIPVGSNGQVLTADSTQTLGLKWAASGGAVATPGTINDLLFWWESDNILATSGQQQQWLANRSPVLPGVFAIAGASGCPLTMSSSTINSLPVLQYSAAGYHAFLSTNFNSSFAGFQCHGGITCFIVIQPGTVAGGNSWAIFGGQVNCLAFYLAKAAGAQICIAAGGGSTLATSTATWVNGTAFQANFTYQPSSGAYAFRQVRAAAGSGTATSGIGNTQIATYIGADAGGANTLGSTNHLLAALIVYNRVLSGAEITSVETYLNTKWGV